MTVESNIYLHPPHSVPESSLNALEIQGDTGLHGLLQATPKLLERASYTSALTANNSKFARIHPGVASDAA